jgi:23S rRNA (adenine2503-C2)-methyltransferase
LLNLKDLTLSELNGALSTWGASELAARKVFARVFDHGVRSLEQLRADPPPQVPKHVLDRLMKEAELPSLEVLERRRAEDGFVKYLFRSPLGGEFEAVRIPLFEEKYVLCVSSQVGCALACDFCATGKLGFQRNLQTWEILDQLLLVRAEADRRVGGVVFMGMGEPLLNLDRVLAAADVMMNPAGCAISGRSITLSTAGVVPAIHRYIEMHLPYRMAFSVTSAIPEKRGRVMPIEKTHPLPTLVDAIRRYAEVRGERAMVAYVCISGFNMGREDALALAEVFRGVPLKLDLIDVTDPTGRYQPPSAEELSAFRDHLQVLGCPIARRYSGGKEIGSGGSLVTLEARSARESKIKTRPEHQPGPGREPGT